MPVNLPRLHITDMHFDNWCGNGSHGVGNCNGGMAVGAGVQHNAVDLSGSLVQPVDEGAFVIALEVVQLDIAKARPEFI